ncbi:hypothetical protein SPURM210S_02926 [Streptomyces purpurascens]
MIAVNSACRKSAENRVQGDHLGLTLPIDLRDSGARGHGGGPVGEGSGGHGMALLSELVAVLRGM